MRILKIIGQGIIVIFALVGMAFTFVFFGIKFGWTDVHGTISQRNTYFKNAEASSGAPSTSTAGAGASGSALNATPAYPHYDWEDSDEWAVIDAALERDQVNINQAAHDAGISPRLLLGGVIGEQFRFFTSERDSFKQYFEPLKILASLTNTSYGIAGLKPATVAHIEQNLKDPNSVYYLGPSMENLITYPPGSDVATVQFSRITDTKNTYYSYLYAGLFMREVIAQWDASGYDISERPDVLSTLYNLGFNHSIPKADPAAGGAPITIDGQTYSFGEIGNDFYYSNELRDVFPN
jgi:hypothetical protein